MNTSTKRILTVLIILLVIGLAFYPKLKTLFKPADGAGDPAKTTAAGGAAKGAGGGPAGGKAGGGPTSVGIMVVNTESLDEKILTTGTVVANEEVEIRSEVSGRVTSIGFREGDYVRRGTVLLRINDADLQAQLQKLNANRKLAEANEQRQKRLFEKEAISRAEYEISQTNLTGILADIENLKAQLAKTVIRAPFDGTIGLRQISVGSYISPATPIATLTNTNPAKIDFSVPAKYAQIVRRGSRIQFTVEGSEANRAGTVYAVEPKVNPETRAMLLRATSPNPNGALVPGAFARIEVVLSARGNAIVVPTEAIIPEQNGQKVYVVRNRKAESVPVQIGLRTDRNVEIKSGLHVGDSLITSGIQMVKPGGEVLVQ
ncbi:efflux RND transporter periplasmic adaptor subunit [Rudanella paleaurantiibacter]|uniref:Efflux RND transporter periplasmic adaptor subunit n=1 Tax=Rudanella paleaurantiibacter TaxID=2614655 RepID=A0A7J5U0X7_9BACT|nr:efflux RND transporter periplasmic adaptor subunit [Rudanella paleaurantiibacter]KAB7731277.1 efflux RND transporter periplasmic adaptor subunit [Rudanella paleaurantiibacter]